MWKKSQVLDLLDSVVRNYPIGSLLLWQSRQELSSENRIADLTINLPKPDYPVNYLLDGQQRLSTICGALYWRGDNPDSIWNIAYDLRAEEFVHLETLEDSPHHMVRANKLADGAEFYRYAATLSTLSASDKDQLIKNADKLFNRFKDYKVAVVTLGDMSIQDVAPIFERVNSAGTRLTVVDLMRAATWSQDFDLVDQIDSIRQVIDAKNFGGLDRKVLLRNLSAAAGGGFSVESIDNLRNLEVAQLREAVAATRAAYERTIDFLTTEIRIPSDSIIPYANQVVVLAELFRLLDRPSAQQYEQIKKWFWRTSLGGYFSGWNTGMMSRDQLNVGAFVEGKSVEIFTATSEPSKSLWKTKQFRLDGAHAKLLGMILAHRGPIDLLTGQRIETSNSLSWTNAKEFHHFFPRDYLKNKGVRPELANSLANIIMLTSSSNKTITNRAPSDYLKQVAASAGGSLSAWLESNLISHAAYEAAACDDFTAFLEERCKTLHEVSFKLAGWKLPQENAA